VHSKVLAVRIVHHLEFAWLPEAHEIFRRSLRLDESLQIPELGHDYRWKAVALSAEDGSQLKMSRRYFRRAANVWPREVPARPA